MCIVNHTEIRKHQSANSLRISPLRQLLSEIPLCRIIDKMPDVPDSSERCQSSLHVTQLTKWLITTGWKWLAFPTMNLSLLILLTFLNCYPSWDWGCCYLKACCCAPDPVRLHPELANSVIVNMKKWAASLKASDDGGIEEERWPNIKAGKLGLVLK
jgi:hypothetical protein